MIPAATRVVVISHRMWQTEFGGASSALGQTLTLRGQPYTIVGVTQPDFRGVVPLLAPELWLPMAQVDEVEPVGITDVVPGPGRTRLERRGMRWMFVKGRLKPGVTAEQAHANVALIGRQLAEAHPQTNKDRRMSAVPTSEVRLLVPQASGIMSMGAAGLMSVVGLVLLIACANVAGMLLARASARRREIGVRLAIGASRARLVRQLLVEGLVLGLLGAIAAVACAWVVIRSLLAIELPLPVEISLDLGIDWRVLAFAVAAAGVTGVLASLLPGAEGVVAEPRRRPARRSAGRSRRRPPLRAARRAGRHAGGVHRRAAGRRGAAAAQPRRIAARRRRLHAPRAWRCCRSTPTWSATRPSAAISSGARRWRASARMPGVVSRRHGLADGAVRVQLQPAGAARRQSHLRRRAARRDHRERRRLRRLRADAGPPRDRRPRSRRHRPRRRAAGGADQRDHGTPLLAERERGRPHVPRGHHPATSTASSGSSRTTRCTACSSGRRRSSTSPRRSVPRATTTCWPAPPATPASCSR